MPINRQDVLRERSRLLLKQLRQPKEKLLRENEPGGEERRRQPRKMATLPGGERRAPRAVLAKPTVRFADTCELHRGIQHSNSPPFKNTNYSGGPTEHTALSDLLEDSYIYPQPINKLEETRPPTAESSSVSDDKDLREVQDRVIPHTDECEDLPASDRCRLQPLLGYDWIAGVLDTEDSVLERSDEFFKDLCVFRSLHKSECIHNGQTEFCEKNRPVSRLLVGKNDHRANMDHHHCTFSYRINSRLYPVPLHSQECCPVCKKHRSSHPHSAAEPALVRVTVPRTALLPSHKYKAHRRCSFDPSDSLGLPSHCLSGWSNRSQSTLPPPSSLDLRSSLKMKNPERSRDNQLQNLPAPTASDGQHFDPISDVSHLARHDFRHFSPRRKVGITFYPV